MPPTIAMALSADLSLAGPLSTVLSLEDLHDILEVIAVGAHNRAASAEASRG